jgi:hypothetical protein
MDTKRCAKRCSSRSLAVLRLGTFLWLAGSGAASAQDSSVLMMAGSGESVADATLARLQSDFSDERARLQLRLKSIEPEQAPGEITTTVEYLTGQQIDQGMHHCMVLTPHGTPVVVGLVGQTDQNNARQLILLNLSAWVAQGRRLGANDEEAFDVLDDDKMQGDGAKFKLEGVTYLAQWVNGSLVFRRN